VVGGVGGCRGEAVRNAIGDDVKGLLGKKYSVADWFTSSRTAPYTKFPESTLNPY